jgi:hypothetical protein
MSGLFYKHNMIKNHDSRIVYKLGDLLTDDATVVIFDVHIFLVQATGTF